MPMMPPPHLLRCSAFSLNSAWKFLARRSSSVWSSFLTVVSATHEANFLCTSFPRRDLPLMMQYGTSFLRQSAGSQTTSSMGSTSWAITTSLASLSSTRVVTWFKPNLTTCGFLVFTSWPSFFCCAVSISRFFFASLVSGTYLLSSLSTCAAWFLSMVLLNWLMEGGTLRRMSRIRFMRCRRMHFGHLTNRVRSRFGWMSPPRRKFFGAFWKRGLSLTFFLLSPRGALGSLRLAAACPALPIALFFPVLLRVGARPWILSRQPK
mmetsp:Transcript_49245/g.139046  ORF Transcript_49245/g.139046 Transcript_49245/m.139046 type:complete len:264 (-) Transcript_49245:13-804(-)